MVHLSKILIATDFSASSDEAFDYALYLATLQRGKLYILHVLSRDLSPVCMIPALEVGPVPELEIPVSPREDEYGAEIKQKMFELVQRVRKEGLIVEDLIVSGKPFHEIIRISQERTVDLIILGSHEKSELESRLLGSTIEKVRRKASCPVLIVKRSPA
ncbi:MAG: universal stress protein [Nitrospiria bacterium]